MGILADIQAISDDSAKTATDQATFDALGIQLKAAQDAIANDTAASTTANAALSTDLQASGPVFVLNSDGSASVYQFADTPPGFTIVKATPAS